MQISFLINSIHLTLKLLLSLGTLIYILGFIYAQFLFMMEVLSFDTYIIMQQLFKLHNI